MSGCTVEQGAHPTGYWTAEDLERLDPKAIARMVAPCVLDERSDGSRIPLPISLSYQVEQLVHRIRARPPAAELPLLKDPGGHQPVDAHSVVVAQQIELHTVSGIASTQNQGRRAADVVVPNDDDMQTVLWERASQKKKKGRRRRRDSDVNVRDHAARFALQLVRTMK